MTYLHKLNRYLDDKNVKKERLAKLLRVSSRQLKRYLIGEINIPIDIAVMIEDFTFGNISVRDLAEESLRKRLERFHPEHAEDSRVQSEDS